MRQLLLLLQDLQALLTTDLQACSQATWEGLFGHALAVSMKESA
jgi:hypothetical protein